MTDTTSARYSIHELVELSGMSARTIHYYVKEKIILPPIRTGGRSRYTEAHLGRLLLIREYQGSGKKLSAIKGILSHLRDEDVNDQIELVKKERETAPIDGDKLMVRRVYAKRSLQKVRVVPETEDSRKLHEPPLEASWKRISIIDGVEINIRDDISRQKRKQMQELIDYLRYNLTENSPT